MIVLHGSSAKGLPGRWSDLDIVVVGDFDLPFIDRIGKLLDLNETRAPIEPLGYTPEEFRSMLSRMNPLALEAVSGGIPLLGEELFDQLRTKLKEMEERGLKRTATTWKIGV